MAYLTQEKTGQECGEQASSVNCQASDLLLLAQELCVADALPDGWESLCPAATLS